MWGYECKTCHIIWGYECQTCLVVTFENMDGAMGRLEKKIAAVLLYRLHSFPFGLFITFPHINSTTEDCNKDIFPPFMKSDYWHPLIVPANCFGHKANFLKINDMILDVLNVQKKKERERKFIQIFVYLAFQCVAQNI